ncbi:MAG TPA: hypothetical protein VGJ75_06770 [Dongiaceae bacterium]
MNGLHAPTVIDHSGAFNPLGKRNLIAVAICTLATGPAVSAILVVWMVTDPMAPIHNSFGVRDLFGYLGLVALSSIPASFVSFPAAVLNSVIHTCLIKHKLDALPWSLVSGGAFGATLGYGLNYLSAYGTEYEPAFVVVYPTGAAGILVGLLYWIIAIRPQRRQRLSLRPPLER